MSIKTYVKRQEDTMHAILLSNNIWEWKEGDTLLNLKVSKKSIENALGVHRPLPSEFSSLPLYDDGEETRECSECGYHEPYSNYSSNQWRKGEGWSRCMDCSPSPPLNDDDMTKIGNYTQGDFKTYIIKNWEKQEDGSYRSPALKEAEDFIQVKRSKESYKGRPLDPVNEYGEFDNAFAFTELHDSPFLEYSIKSYIRQKWRPENLGADPVYMEKMGKIWAEERKKTNLQRLPPPKPDTCEVGCSISSPKRRRSRSSPKRRRSRSSPKRRRSRSSPKRRRSRSSPKRRRSRSSPKRRRSRSSPKRRRSRSSPKRRRSRR